MAVGSGPFLSTVFSVVLWPACAVSVGSIQNASHQGFAAELLSLSGLGTGALAVEERVEALAAKGRHFLTVAPTSNVAMTGESRSVAPIPPQHRTLYFRPVSATLICVMILTGESLVVYTSLALSRNSDELSGRLTPSLTTETLSAASRSATYSSMLSVLFVACRMYVLATTEGLGEPPIWVKASMIIATGGMTLQLLIVFLLPLATKDRSEETGKSFSELTGGPNDVHPMLEEHEWEHGYLKDFFWGKQAFAVALMHGGWLGVLVGIFTFPARTTKVSSAVINTCILSALYFFSLLLLWIARHNEKKADTQGYYVKASRARDQKPVVAEADGNGVETPLLNAALSLSTTARKAPMVAIFFLCARMRALQLDPPLGMPPPWLQGLFYVITASLTLEACVAAYIGAVGKEEQGYYGVHTYTASRHLQLVRHFFAFIVYILMIPVGFAILGMGEENGMRVPLSRTVRTVFQFQILCFIVYGGQWLTLVAKDCFDWSMPVMQDTFVAAGVAVTTVPLLCILFVACRMRALQITQHQGNPPIWAQDCMLMCVFATTLQVVCCVLMPIFTNLAAEVDGDGNVEYDLRPMVGAYAVCFVKFAALFSMHIGVIIICIAICIMTPEMCLVGEVQVTMVQVVETVAVTFFIVLLALFFSSGKVIGLAIKFGIESADEALLGTQVHVNKAALSLCEGYVNVSGLLVENPPNMPHGNEGHSEWRSQCLFRVDRLVVKVNMWKLTTSLGKQFEIEAAILQGVEVVFEKPHWRSPSNMEMIVEHLQKGTGDESAEKKKPAPVKQSEPKKKPVPSEEPEKGKAAPDAAEPKQAVDLMIHVVKMKEITGEAILPVGRVELRIAPIEFDDMQKELDSRKAKVAADIVAAIIKTICRSVAATAASQFTTQGVVNMKEKGCLAIHTLAQKAQDICSPKPGSKPGPLKPQPKLPAPSASSSS